MSFKDTIELYEYILKNNGSFCYICGITFTTVREGRKHELAKHYEHCLDQCNGNKELLKEWANLP